MKKDEAIIIRRSQKKRPPSKRNQWKSLLANFSMLAMALFLLLWMAAFSTPEQKAAVSTYFQTPGDMDSIKAAVLAVQETQEASPLEAEMVAVLEKAVHQRTARDKLYDELQQQIKQQLSHLPHEFGDAMVITKTGRGLNLEILEQEGQPMFSRGSDKLMPVYQQMVLSLAPKLKATGENIAIHGHTDATRFSIGAERDNWDLSTSRAQEARRVLIQGGFPAERIAQVAGMADRRLRDPDNPGSAINRRVEILMAITEH